MLYAVHGDSLAAFAAGWTLHRREHRLRLHVAPTLFTPTADDEFWLLGWRPPFRRLFALTAGIRALHYVPVGLDPALADLELLQAREPRFRLRAGPEAAWRRVPAPAPAPRLWEGLEDATIRGALEIAPRSLATWDAIEEARGRGESWEEWSHYGHAIRDARAHLAARQAARGALAPVGPGGAALPVANATAAQGETLEALLAAHPEAPAAAVFADDVAAGRRRWRLRARADLDALALAGELGLETRPGQREAEFEEDLP